MVTHPARFSRSLPRDAGEGWGGGDPVAFAPLPASPRERGEEQKPEARRCR